MRLQVWYRNVGSSACGVGFNLTNAVEAIFSP
jgi:hypothetical protein